MASIYWIGSNSDWDTVGNWSDTSGGAANATTPTTNDDVVFDSNSPGDCTAGPASPVSLTSLTNTGFIYSLPSLSNITIADNGTLTLENASTFDGIIGNDVTASLAGSSIFNPGTIGTGVILNLTESTNSKTANYLQLNCSGASANNQAACQAATLSVNVGCSLQNDAAITGITTLTLISATTISGTGSLTASGTQTIPSNFTLANTYTGNLLVTGVNAELSTIVVVTGNVTLANGGKSHATVVGTLTAPAANNGDGTWGYTPGALGAFTTLKLTGITGGSGTSIDTTIPTLNL